MINIGLLIISAIRSSVCVALASIGANFSSRSGVMPMGGEGFILMGAFCAVAGSYFTGSAFAGLLCGILGALIFAMLHALMCVKFQMNQVICGIGFNMFSLGITTSLTQIIWGSRANSESVATLPVIHLPVLGNISFIIPLTVVIGIAAWIFMFKTVPGMHLRMVGENPVAAKANGINTKKYKYIGCAMSGILCGLAGSYLSIAHVNRFTYDMSAGRGYIAVAVNILGKYNPIGSLLASLLFGFSDAIKSLFSGVPSQLMDMIPYAVTLIVITLCIRHVRPPAGVGKSDED